jgi:preprotein translocase subunit SecY
MQKLITIFRIPELQTKIGFTLLLLAIYRLGFWIPLPFVDQESLKQWADQLYGSDWNMVVGNLTLLSGSNLGTNTIFGLGIMPYISASIIFQLLASVVPQLEALRKEGQVGQKKLNEYTRYATVAVCVLQSFFWLNILFNQKVGDGISIVGDKYLEDRWFYMMVGIFVMTAGSMFLMWIGEQIDEYGIGNGISLIIMSGIIGRLPEAISKIWAGIVEAGGPQIVPDTGIGIEKIVLLIALFLAVVVGVTLMTQGQRRIPVQSAKHTRGRMVMGGARQYLPLRVNQAGVMPIIFASSLLMFPGLILRGVANFFGWDWLALVAESFSNQGYLYLIGEIALIYFFCYFWTAITFNPKDMSNNLKDYGAFIPGYRPGKRTADYLEKVMLRITYVGAAFLAIVAIIPSMVSRAMNIDWVIASFFGGTSLLIIISVALDLIQKIDSHLIMRNYESLLGPDATNS